MPEVIYIAQQAVKTEPYEGAVIDVPTQDAAVAELASRLAIRQASEQRQVDMQAIAALADAVARITGLEQRQDLLRKDLDQVATVNLDASDIAKQASEDARAARDAVKAVPAVDLASVARLANDVQSYGIRTVNQAAESLEQITTLAADTIAQTEALRSEVEQIIGNASATVDAIKGASDAVVEAGQADIRALLEATATQVAASVEARLGEVEVLIGGQVNPDNQFEWQWQFAKLAAPEEVTRTVVMPILPGWEGAPRRI